MPNIITFLELLECCKLNGVPRGLLGMCMPIRFIPPALMSLKLRNFYGINLTELTKYSRVAQQCKKNHNTGNFKID